MVPVAMVGQIDRMDDDQLEQHALATLQREPWGLGAGAVSAGLSSGDGGLHTGRARVARWIERAGSAGEELTGSTRIGGGERKAIQSFRFATLRPAAA